jgi:hypothetical protein
MKNSDAKLDRLFELARRAPAMAESPATSHWQTRVLAHWPPSQPHTELWSSLHRNVRRGFICAAIFMCACILWSLNSSSQDTEADFDIASFELRVDGIQ